MNKATAIAPANIALIKYWGMRDAERILPANASISMTLSRCVTRTTIAVLGQDAADEVLYRQTDGSLCLASEDFTQLVSRHLDRLRALSGTSAGLRVATVNSFPTGAGIASSASGFAALTIAAGAVLGLSKDAADLSRLARLSGSGSAARSVLGGFVLWPSDEADLEAPARQVAPPDHWPLHDLVAVVDSTPKAITSREGHRRALGSPYYPRRQEMLPGRLERVNRALATRDFALLAEVVEEEAIDLHLIAMSAQPPTFYWRAATLTVLECVRQLRADGLEVCATIDAGPNVHVLCTPEHVARARVALASLPGVRELIDDMVGTGPAYSDEHLF